MAKIHHQFPQYGTYSKNSRRPQSWAQCGLLHSNPEAQSGRSGRWQDAVNRAGQHYQSWRSQEMPGKKKKKREIWKLGQTTLETTMYSMCWNKFKLSYAMEVFYIL